MDKSIFSEVNDLYIEGLKHYREKNFELAYSIFSTGAKENDTRCIHAQGLCIFNGKGVKQNKRIGKKIVVENISRLEEAGMQNIPGANKLLYLAYSHNDLSFLLDYRKSFEALERIYDHQVELEEDLLMDLADCYQRELGTVRNHEKANELYRECAEKFNSTNAMVNLALNCLVGLTRNDISTPDITQGIYYLKKAAELKDMKALPDLIDICLGVDKFDKVNNMVDYTLAKEYIEVLRDNTQVSGDIYLSLYFAMLEDYKKMEEVLSKLNCSNEDASTVFHNIWRNITFICHRSKETSERVEKWKIACIEYLIKFNVPDSQIFTHMAYFYLGIYYDNDSNNRNYDEKYVDKVINKATESYLKGIENNESWSYREYANLLYNGEHVEKDQKRAFELFVKGYEIEPDGWCANKIAQAYEYGIGTRKSKRKAIEYYLKASKSERGYTFANINLLYLTADSKNEDVKAMRKKWDRMIKRFGIDPDSHSCLSELKLSLYDSPLVYAKKYHWIIQYLYKCGLKESPAYEIARAYETGTGFKVDKKKALSLYKKALQDGEISVAVEIGRMYYEAEGGIKRNIPLAIKYLEIGSKTFGYQGYANLELFKIYSDNSTKYFDMEKAIKCLEDVPKDDEYSIGQAKYLLGYVYHFSGLVKKNLKKAIENYRLAEKYGYRCSYAIEIAENELKLNNYFELGKRNGMSNKEARFFARKEFEKSDKNNPFRIFVERNLLSENLSKQDKLSKIKEELTRDFAEIWDSLGNEAQKALVTGIYIYSAMLEVGVDYYHDLDFAPVINQFSKAFEIQLKKYFYVGFIQYLKRNKIDVHEFVKPSETKQLSIVETYYKDKKRTKIAYRYYDETNEYATPFSLGSLKFIITFDLHSKTPYSNEINPHVLSYVKEIFKDDVFEYANYDLDLKNYLLDLANDTKTIMDRRNPSSHGTFMPIDEAEVCANYLMKVKKVIYRFMSKLKEDKR